MWNENAQNIPESTLCNLNLAVFIYHSTVVENTLLLLLKEGSKNKMQWNNNLNLLFGVLVDNMRGHFTRCSHFSSSLRGSEKFYATRKISARTTKTPNKV